jgi:CubicO group peptidase (beta-lactamase class C family)
MTKVETVQASSLETKFEQMMKDLHVPGAAIAIVKDGKVILSKGFGYRNVEKKQPVTPQTRFAIGSSTKAFGTFSLSLLAQQNKFDWDAPVQSYLPSFSLCDKLASDQITGRDLAAHRSGVGRHDILWYSLPLSRKEIVEKIKHLPLDAPFRTNFLYNNLMYATTSSIVEKITNQTWEQYVTENMLQPLQMNHTNFSVIDSQHTDNYALPYTEKDGDTIEIPFRNIDTIGAAGNINSTIEDMAKWVLLHLNQGKIDDHQLLAPELLQQMYTPHNIVPDQPPFSIPESPLNSYGLGWFISSYRGYKIIHHGGNIDGFSALASFIPSENIGLVILTNVDGSLLPSYMANEIYDEFLGLESIDWHKRAVKDAAMFKEIIKQVTQSLPEQIKDTKPSHPLQDFTGTFEHPAYGTLEVYESNNELHIKFLDIDIPLAHYHYDMFSSTFDWMQIKMSILLTYNMNTEGNFQEVQLHLPVILSMKPLIFTKVD